MIKTLYKAAIVLGIGSLTLAYAATPVTSAANTKLEESGSYLVYKNVGTETLETEKALSLLNATMYFVDNEALQVNQLQDIIAGQEKVMAKLGIKFNPSWQDVDNTTVNLLKNFSTYDSFVQALQGAHTFLQPGSGVVNAVTMDMNAYVANLAVLASQNEALILNRLQTCLNQDSLKQCGSV